MEQYLMYLPILYHDHSPFETHFEHIKIED